MKNQRMRSNDGTLRLEKRINCSVAANVWRRRPRLKDTLQAEASDVSLDEVEVLVFVIVLLLQRADGVALRRGGQA